MAKKGEVDNTNFDADAAHVQRHFSIRPLPIFS
jgi:hypothetical protein